MAMGMGPVADNPDAYIAALSDWQRERAEMMRGAILRAAPFEETIKWTNLVFMANGPCILIRAEEHRMLLGFWRGKRLRALEPRIRASGKYELGNLVMTEATEVTPATVERLAAEAFRLNAELGDPSVRA
ncbi:hypothetical protein SKP52_07145 [Sphingopyxis fribergensis]|uniref:YdhG-like domain-containing protein n=1 Tax=Sphingopyxis fribergensis TaxID=1515612 RepID=A0A0A7PEA5_9SPHN|nr:DUF1801 domain-containing protein [Sphingopyxis fribergensis]AJA08350.1 hypothetical protein SKP52_07145 [Sphingopyxis fribergensis]